MTHALFTVLCGAGQPRGCRQRRMLLTDSNVLFCPVCDPGLASIAGRAAHHLPPGARWWTVTSIEPPTSPAADQ